MQPQERQTKTGPPNRRNRGWLLAAAVAALVVLIGAIAIGLRSDSGTDVVEPTPTTMSAPTTVPTPTTTPPATTVPATTLPPATAAPVVFEQQTYDATVTWDGETCTYEGPRAARAGDTVTMTFTNNSEVLGGFEVGYLTSQASREDLVEYLGPMFDITTYVPPTFALRWHSFTEGTPEAGTGPLLDRRQLLQPGRSVANEISLELARTHVFVCHGDTSGPDTPPPVPVDVAASAMTVVEGTEPLPELPPQAFDASMTWDGATCIYEGPDAVRAGDTLNMTFTNDSALLAGFDVGYLTGDATLEDLVDYLGATYNIANFVAPTFALSWHPVAEASDSSGPPGPLLGSGELLQAGRSVSNEISIELARRHVFVCTGGPADVTAEALDVPVDVADIMMMVTE